MNKYKLGEKVEYCFYDKLNCTKEKREGYITGVTQLLRNYYTTKKDKIIIKYEINKKYTIEESDIITLLMPYIPKDIPIKIHTYYLSKKYSDRLDEIYEYVKKTERKLDNLNKILFLYRF